MQWRYLYRLRSGIYLAVQTFEIINGVGLVLATKFITLVFGNTALQNRTRYQFYDFFY